MNIQPLLENEQVKLIPLKEEDFEALYEVASDPLVWEQHPNNDRWQREVFRNFFEGALASKGAFKIVEKSTGKVIGSTRFYNYDEAANSVFIGYTFYERAQWGKGVNSSVKNLMLDYAFQFVEKVHFHVGAINKRSQIAVERLGAVKIAEESVAYYGEAPKFNYLYELTKEVCTLIIN
jgi:RimJ/RimL family protein N-acetyltransferase